MFRSAFRSGRLVLFAGACLILVFQAGASRMLKIDEAKIALPGLHQLPWQFGNWKASSEESIGPDVEAYLKPDEYILRDYVNPQNGNDVNLFVAYFKSLQNNYGPHSPSICLPGAGWLISSSKVINMPVPGRAAGIPVNEFTMEKSNEHILVLYWYQNDRNIWTDQYQAKLRLLPDLIRYRRSDVSLVRLVVPMRAGTPDNEIASTFEFANLMFPALVERFVTARSE
jgi:EpsI family protein